MSLSNCNGCGKLHMQHVDVLCNECLKQFIEDTHLVKKLLHQHPCANMIDVVNQTGFSLKKVKELVNR